MSDDALKAIAVNIERLTRASLRLYRKKDFASSTHFSIICTEECSKYMLLYCKSHLPDLTYRKRFQHAHKTRAFLAFWYVYGGLSLVFVMQKLIKSRAGGLLSSNRTGLVSMSAELAGWNNPSSIALAILHCLEGSEKGEYRLSVDDSILKREKMRLQSVYVDVDDDGLIIGGPSMISRKQARECISNAMMARAVIRYIVQDDWDPGVFVGFLPRSERHRTEREAEEHAADYLRSLDSMIPPSQL